MSNSTSNDQIAPTFSQTIDLPENKIGSSIFPGINHVKILKQKFGYHVGRDFKAEVWSRFLS